MLSRTRLVALTTLGTLSFCAGLATAAPPTYNITDITNWNAQQLQTLPFFKHYFPAAIPIPNAPTDFHFVARTPSGLIAGSTWNVFTGPNQRGALLTSTTATVINSFGDFYWWRLSPPASATYQVANANDVNASGVVVGLANLPGASQTSGQTPVLHPITYDAVHGLVDIIPSCQSGSATCINDNGEIAGTASGGPFAGGYAFRLSPGGQVTQMGVMPPGYIATPKRMNANGVLIGSSVPGGWASWGTAVVPLPKLFDMPLATASDLNDSAWIVGTSEVWDHTEYYATLWEPENDGFGGWIAHDLTSLLATDGILLDRAVAINNQGKIIVSGHTDTNTPVYGTYLLTPITCVPEISVQPQPVVACAGPVTFSVQITNPTPSTTYQWFKDSVEINPATNPSAVTPTLTLTTISTTDIAEYNCIVTNSCGPTPSDPAALDVPCGPICDSIDFNNDGLFPDTADIDDFLSVFSGGPCSTGTCGDIDFNNDGLFPDTADIDSLLSVFSGGACL